MSCSIWVGKLLLWSLKSREAPSSKLYFASYIISWSHIGQVSLLSIHSRMHERWKWCLHFVIIFGFSALYSSRQVGQTSSSSIADTLRSPDFRSSNLNFFGEARRMSETVSQSDSLTSTHVDKFSQSLPLIPSLRDSESVDCERPRTTSYGIGAGGAW